MKAVGTASIYRSRFDSLLVGLAALAGPVAVLHAQEPTTTPTPVETTSTELLSPGSTSSDVRGELNTAVPESNAIFDVGIEDVLPQSFNDWRADMKERHGFEFGIAYTAVVQNASGGPGDRNAAGGDIDLFGTWRLIGTPEKNAGTLIWAADNRHSLFTDLTPQELGPEIGTLFDTTDGFNERDFALRQLFWQQNLVDNKLILSGGKLDPGNYYNGNRASNDNMLALNKALSANAARFFPQEGIGANVKVVPQDLFYFSAGIHDANAVGTQTGLNTMFDGDYLYAAEFGLTPMLGGGELEGIYRFSAWYNDFAENFDKESGWGFGISISQFITPTSGVAFRYGWQSEDDVEVEQVLSAQYLSFVGGKRAKDVWGVGVGWGKPSDGELDDEFIAETFYRIQLTRNAQLTPDVQFVFNPSNAPDDDALVVFGLRFRTAF